MLLWSYLIGFALKQRINWVQNLNSNYPHPILRLVCMSLCWQSEEKDSEHVFFLWVTIDDNWKSGRLKWFGGRYQHRRETSTWYLLTCQSKMERLCYREKQRGRREWSIRREGEKDTDSERKGESEKGKERDRERERESERKRKIEREWKREREKGKEIEIVREGDSEIARGYWPQSCF